MKIFLILSLLVFSSCASFSRQGQFLSRLNLSNVSQVSIGKTTASDLRERFGEPSSILPVGQYQALIYAFEGRQRATFTVDSRQVVLAAIWMPFSDQECVSKECLLGFFKDAHFTEELKYEKVGKTEKVPYFDFHDRSKGISFQMPKASNKVSAVTFDAQSQK